ncbi:MAG: mechanosensitive ion channel domain-containing protein [Caldilineales bacterium]
MSSIPVWAERLLTILLLFMLAWLVHLLSWRLAGRLARLHRLTRGNRSMRAERALTLQGLLSSALTLIAIVAAILGSLSLFIDTNTLIWIIGLFSAAFGLGARNVVNDFVSGMSLIFADDYDVGEKVEVMGVEGVIEAVNVRTTKLRAPTGELFVVPNGDVRLIRNFSRGRFSMTHITLKLASADLPRAILLLETLGQEATDMLPNLLEPWQVISESGVIGQSTDLTLLAKARFGKAAEMRPRLLALVQDRLFEQGIELHS